MIDADEDKQEKQKVIQEMTKIEKNNYDFLKDNDEGDNLKDMLFGIMFKEENPKEEEAEEEAED
jgi:hypothetical protein